MNAAADSRLGLILAIAVSASLFTALCGAILISRAGALTPWVLPEKPLHAILGALLLVVLAIGSFMLQTARKCLDRGDLFGMRATMLNASAKGLAYLVLLGLQFHLLVGERFLPGTSTFAALFYIAFALHAMHVVTAMLLVVPLAVGHRPPPPERLRNATTFWYYTTVTGAAIVAVFHLL